MLSGAFDDVGLFSGSKRILGCGFAGREYVSHCSLGYIERRCLPGGYAFGYLRHGCSCAVVLAEILAHSKKVFVSLLIKKFVHIYLFYAFLYAKLSLRRRDSKNTFQPKETLS